MGERRRLQPLGERRSPVTLRELVDPAELEGLLDTELDYPQANGLPSLRERIAALYPGATPDNVLVTVGCAEANFITLQTLLQPGDEMVVMLPNYMQIWGIGQNLGFQVKSFHLHEENGWAPDLAQLEAAVSEQTKLIAVCNPNNPTGYILTPDEMDAIVAAADRVGAWLIGRRGVQRCRATHRYPDTLLLGALRPRAGDEQPQQGLRPAGAAHRLGGRLRPTWSITSGRATNTLPSAPPCCPTSWRPLPCRPGAAAAHPRARDYIRRGYPVLQAWLDSHPGTFSLIPPQAAAIAFVRYHLDVNSTELVDRLMHKERAGRSGRSLWPRPPSANQLWPSA